LSFGFLGGFDVARCLRLSGEGNRDDEHGETEEDDCAQTRMMKTHGTLPPEKRAENWPYSF
jgi:hypothetical protein